MSFRTAAGWVMECSNWMPIHSVICAAHIEDIPDALTRGSAWVDLWDNVLEARGRPRSFSIWRRGRFRARAMSRTRSGSCPI